MSYDIRIVKGKDPYGESLRPLSVAGLIDAVNSFPPFRERGITWDNERWNDYAPWRGLVIELEEWDRNSAAAESRTRDMGEADACNIYVSLGSESEIAACMALAVHVARAAGATAWDLQQDCVLSPTQFEKGRGRFKQMQAWLRSVLRRADGNNDESGTKN